MLLKITLIAYSVKFVLHFFLWVVSLLIHIAE